MLTGATTADHNARICLDPLVPYQRVVTTARAIPRLCLRTSTAGLGQHAWSSTIQPWLWS